MRGRWSSATAAPRLPAGAHARAPTSCRSSMGADYIEPDLVATKDGVLVARHEPEIGGTTDVADHPEFAARKTTKTDRRRRRHRLVHRGLHARRAEDAARHGAHPDVRPRNTLYDGRFEIPTFQEVIDLRAAVAERAADRHLPRDQAPDATSAPRACRSSRALVARCSRNGLNRPDAPVFVQSFEIGNLQALRRTSCDVPLVQLTRRPGPVGPRRRAATRATYADLATPAGLRKSRRYADGIGRGRPTSCRARAGDSLPATTSLSGRAPGRPVVHPYTFRRENPFLPRELRSRPDPNAYGDPFARSGQFLRPRGGRLLHRQRRLRRPGPLLASPSMPQVAHRVAYPRLSVLPGGQPAGERIAAVIDLGSNSWRLVVYAYLPGASWRRDRRAAGAGADRRRPRAAAGSADPARSRAGWRRSSVRALLPRPRDRPPRPSTSWPPARSATPPTAPSCSRARRSRPASRSGAVGGGGGALRVRRRRQLDDAERRRRARPRRRQPAARAGRGPPAEASGSWPLGAVRVTERLLARPRAVARKQLKRARAAVRERARGRRLARGRRPARRHGRRRPQPRRRAPPGAGAGPIQGTPARGRRAARAVGELARRRRRERGAARASRPRARTSSSAPRVVLEAMLELGGFDAIEVTRAGLREGVFFSRRAARRRRPLLAGRPRRRRSATSRCSPARTSATPTTSPGSRCSSTTRWPPRA